MNVNAKTKRAFSWLVVAVGASTSACAARSGLTAGRQVVVVQRVDGPYVRAGTEFDVEFEQPIGADTSQAGDAFVARVTTPLKAPNGHDVVPVGARLTGTVIEAIVLGSSAIALNFATIDTVRGPSAIHAKVQSAGNYASVALIPSAVPQPEAGQIDALLRPPVGTAVGGGPPQPGALAPVHIPARGVVRLALVAPLYPAGVVVERPPGDMPYPNYTAPPFREPPYRGPLIVPSNPLDQLSP
jgi:hypothetical protein